MERKRKEKTTLTHPPIIEKSGKESSSQHIAVLGIKQKGKKGEKGRRGKEQGQLFAPSL